MTTGDWGMLQPATAGTPDAADDDHVLAAMVQVEAALLRAWARLEGTDDDAAARALDAVAANPAELDRSTLVDGVARDGVVVVTLLELLQDHLEQREIPAYRLHTGATSQDILDTALMLVARTTFERLRVRLVAAGTALAVLADVERDAAARRAHPRPQRRADDARGAGRRVAGRDQLGGGGRRRDAVPGPARRRGRHRASRPTAPRADPARSPPSGPRSPRSWASTTRSARGTPNGPPSSRSRRRRRR